jgi:glycosyltransferase involved in cell wall biosynthesis
MPKDNHSIQLAHELKCCIIVPSFNNVHTLQAVINDVIQYVDDVIIVNDGSTDNTTDILSSISTASVISYQPNRGKGYALRKGFKRALEIGFHYALTIDSDGQHYGSDIPRFLKKVQQYPDSLIVGSRLLKQDNMPDGSTFANKFSNFWFRLQTGINLPDTQCGFRLYPLEKLDGMRFISNRYEGELEMIVRAAWRGINVCDTAISVYYPPQDERISHFRPFRDFFRISILNTFLTIIALFYAIPKRWILKLARNR